MKRYIISLDQGTTGSRCIIFDKEHNIVSTRSQELTQYYPKPGWVEHDPMEIYSSQHVLMKEAVDAVGISPGDIAAIGISNQRETTIVWDRRTGKPIYNAIVWQCRRTAGICEQLKQKDGFADYVHEKTGLIIDAYFSATKVKWILDNVEGARQRAEAGDLLFGTVNTWLLWHLTGGKVHATDYTNASRTMMFDIKALQWDEKILQELGIPDSMLPIVMSSSEEYGVTEIDGVEVPITGMAGDQHASLFGQACFSTGQAKNTYGTGCFMLMNTGDKLCTSNNGLLTTIAASQKGGVQYAVEGSIFMGGAIVQWLRDELHLLHESRDSEYYAQKIPDNGGVYLVPAFTGLGAPYWDMYARGTIVGLTRGASSEHLIRAALEAIAYQSREVLVAMQADTGIRMSRLKVDGGACANNFLMQFQADIMDTHVVRPRVLETSALGAAYLAGLAVGVWKDTWEIENQWIQDKSFDPGMDDVDRKRYIRGWTRAVERARAWEETDDDES